MKLEQRISFFTSGVRDSETSINFNENKSGIKNDLYRKNQPSSSFTQTD